jgi:hypothetical protein
MPKGGGVWRRVESFLPRRQLLALRQWPFGLRMLGTPLCRLRTPVTTGVQTGPGPIAASKLGFTLTHEHVVRADYQAPGSRKTFSSREISVADAVNKRRGGARLELGESGAG